MKIYVAQISKSCLGSVEIIVEKGENAVHQHFLLFPQYFKSFFFFQGRDCVVKD